MRRALARAMSAPRSRAHVLDKNNVKERTTTIEAAAEQDLSYFVEVSPGVLALDLDTEDAPKKAQELAAQLLINGYAPVITDSGREDHRHVLARVPLEQRRRILREVGLQADRRAVRTTLRPPGSLHRSGELRSEVLLPTADSDVLARLTGTARIRPLGSQARWLLKSAPRASSVSDTLFSIALGAANAGWTFEDLVTVLTCQAIPAHALLLDRVERRGYEETMHWLRTYVWTRAVQQIAEAPARRAHEDPELLGIASAALSRAWPGRSGSTDLLVFMAMVRKRLESGRRVFDLSQREICEMAGISGRDTVRRSLERLCDANLIAQVGERPEDPRIRVRNSASWELTLDQQGEQVLGTAALTRILDDLASDAFRNTIALGGAAGHLYAVLTFLGPTSASHLVTITGMSPRTCRGHLKAMAEAGLVLARDGLFEVGEADLQVAAKELGADGRGEHQQNQFVRQRDARDIMHPG